MPGSRSKAATPSTSLAHLSLPDPRNRLERHRARASLKNVLFGDVDVAPVRLGRYELIETLGRGGMGTVYRARDPHLRRQVAIKVLHDDRAREADRRRLRREAQSLAALAHPNVVGVFEVGQADDELYIVMELVEGQTLRQWQTTPRRLDEILAIYRAAGRGLAAAHRLGLVHRDFKPDNVLIGRDGRPRVVDFGLARVGETVERFAQTHPLASLESLPPEGGLTATGSVLGTPAYMSPEQFDEAQLTAASDQFSFCVALWEAVCKERPFKGHDYVSLATAVLDGRLEFPPASAMPRWLRRVLVRGLSRFPVRRWPDMETLLHALEIGPRQTGRRRVALAGVGALVLTSASLLYEAEASPGCDAVGSELHPVWSAERADRLRGSIERTGLPYAPAVANRIIGALDEHANGWMQTRREICRRSSDGRSRDAALECLARARISMDALVSALDPKDGAQLQEAVGVATNLPDPRRCSEDDEAEVSRPTDPLVATRVEELRRSLARANVLRRLGRYGAGLEIALETVAAADVIGYLPLRAEAWVSLGELQFHAGESEEAAQSIHRAFDLAQEAGLDVLSADAAVLLAEVLLTRLSRFDEARQWIEHARATHQRIGGHRHVARLDYLEGRLALDRGDVDTARTKLRDALETAREETTEWTDVENPARFTLGRLELSTGNLETARELFQAAHQREIERYGIEHPRVATTHGALATLALHSGDLEGALGHARRALEINRGAFPEHSVDVARALNNLGGMLGYAAKFEEAAPYFEEALSIYREVLPPGHPSLLTTLGNLGELHHKLGHHERAERLLLQALFERERVYGPEHPDVAIDLISLGNIAYYQGRLDLARQRHQRALGILERIDPEHSELPNALGALATVLAEAGEHDQALEHYQRAYTLAASISGPDHPETLMLAVDIADVELERGDGRGVLERLETLLPRLESSMGADHPDLAFALVVAARAAIEQHRFARAIELAERALELRKNNAVDPTLVADACMTLGRALWTGGSDRARARSLVKEAGDIWEAAGSAETKNLEASKRWLRAHGG